ncbi:elongation factor 1-alpha C-terminal domain-related protein [Yinghuangia aomiensis]
MTVLPSGFTTRITGIDGPDGPTDEAFAPMSVALRLADDLDVSRGDMICRPDNRPSTSQDLHAVVCWLSDREGLRPGATYALKQTTRTTRARVGELRYCLDVNTGHRDTERLRNWRRPQRDRPRDPAYHYTADVRPRTIATAPPVRSS